MTSEKNASSITLSNNDISIDIEKDVIEKLGALCYTPKELAMYFEVSEDIIENELNNVDSAFNFYLKRGRLLSEAKEQMALLDSAQGGNITAGERLEKIRREKSFAISKEDIFGSIASESKFSKLQDYLTSGASIGISNDEALYLDTLRWIDGIERHYGRRQTIKLLQNKPFNLHFNKAREMIDEATNLFYSEKNTDKKTLCNKRAQMMEEMAILLKKNGKNSMDFKVAGDLLVQASKLQGLDKQDMPVLPKEAYQQPVRIFMLDPEKVGLLGTDRRQVAEDINKLTIPEIHKKRISYEALIEDVLPLTEMLEDVAKEN